MYEAGQFVRIRERKWEVIDDRAPTTGGRDHLLHVRGSDDDVLGQERLFIYRPGVDGVDDANPSVERVTLLPTTELQWPPQGSAISWQRLHDAYRLSIAHSPDSLLGLSRARLSVEPYQLDPVLRVMTAPRQRFLLAEDVGMGKTIEAGLIMMELIARGRCERILIVVPAALQDQWGDEMEQKFDLSFQIVDSETLSKEIVPNLPPGANPWTYTNRVITSIDFAKQERILRALKRTQWDLIVVDEAHYLSESGNELKPLRTDRSRFGEEIAKLSDNLLLLTATPHNGYAQGFYSLLRLLDDARFPSPSNLNNKAIQEVVIRRSKKQIFDDQGNHKFVDRTIKHITLSINDPQMRLERRLYNKISEYSRAQWKAARNDKNRRVTIGFAMMLLKKRFISSPAAIRKSLETRLRNLSAEKLDKDSRLFASHRKGMPTTENQQEQLHRMAMAQTTSDPRDEKALQKEREKLQELLKLAEEITPQKDFKTQQIKKKLDELCFGPERRKVIVFTEYKDTLDYLEEYLSANGYRGRIVVLHGHLNRHQRLAAEQQFHQPETLVMLATDAASEGLNFQRGCHTIIHNELPWNPNRLEQRNGRVDRWGQGQQVEVFNTILQGTLETQILQKLIAKLDIIRDQLRMAPDVLSIAEAIQMDELEDMVMEGLFKIYDDEQPDSLATVGDEIEQKIDERITSADEKLKVWLARVSDNPGAFGKADYKTIARIEQRTQNAVPHDEKLEEFALATLKDLASSSFQPIQGRPHLYRLEVPASLRRVGVKEVYERATFVSKVARDPEYSLEKLEFITQGHPLMTGLISLVKADARNNQSSGLTQPLGNRFAIRILSDTQRGFLFTFLGRWQDKRGSIVAEEVETLFLPLGRPLLTHQEAQQTGKQLLALEPVRRNVTPHLLETVYKPRWQEYVEQARVLARSASQEQAGHIRQQRYEKLALLEEDIHVWEQARTQWVQQQSEQRKHDEEGAIQMTFSDIERAGVRAGAAKRRQNELEREKKAIANRALVRKHEIEQMKDIIAVVPELIGALVIVPEKDC